MNHNFPNIFNCVDNHYKSAINAQNTMAQQHHSNTSQNDYYNTKFDDIDTNYFDQKVLALIGMLKCEPPCNVDFDVSILSVRLTFINCYSFHTRYMESYRSMLELVWNKIHNENDVDKINTMLRLLNNAINIGYDKSLTIQINLLAKVVM